jgi:hypothetical protein
VFIRGYFLHFFLVSWWLCGYESIMQNKPNFRSNKRNTTFLLTKDYEQITMNNEPIKTNPNKPNYHSWSIFPPHQVSFFALCFRALVPDTIPASRK